MENKTLQVGKRERLKKSKSFPLPKQDEVLRPTTSSQNMTTEEHIREADKTSNKLMKGKDGDGKKSSNNRQSIVASTAKEQRPMVVRHKSTNIPPLPSIYKQYKNSLDSKYFSKWQSHNRGFPLSNATEIDVINEEDGMGCAKKQPVHLLTRFPTSPEFNAVFESIVKTDMVNQVH